MLDVYEGVQEIEAFPHPYKFDSDIAHHVNNFRELKEEGSPPLIKQKFLYNSPYLSTVQFQVPHVQFSSNCKKFPSSWSDREARGEICVMLYKMNDTAAPLCFQ
uniref:Uncharacterized protein n=1 Tax=Romanomermis culicivorax TaxID=13658 RepID=A0A915JXN2_ROMCU